MIEIELATPARIAGAVAAPQSLWFLLRLWLAAAGGDAAGWVREAQLRERFAASRNLRMLVSRGFADFARWGVRVGWGTDPTRATDALPLAGRNRGPFWLAPGQLLRLRILLRGQPATAAQVADWLGATTAGDAAPKAAASMASTAYWHAWAAARRDLLDGRLIVDGGQGALAGYRRAQALAPDGYLRALALLQQAMVWRRALALLQQAMVWRRAGNADAARTVLAELERQWHDTPAPEHAWLGAMAAIVSAWCAYAGRDPLVAQQILHAAASDPRWTALFQHHPRVRSEHANLQALIARAFALDAALPQIERELTAQAAVAHYQRALALANEAELFDAAASAASNLGWSLWLFTRCRLVGIEAGDPPLRWIALAAWLCDRHAVGGGSWNTIYLLRMVRDGGPQDPHPEVSRFRQWPVFTPTEFRTAVAPLASATRWNRWLDLALAELADVDLGHVQVDALQRANLLLEVAWYEAHEGDLSRAALAVQRLRRRLRELNPVDRTFFRDAIRRLPELAP